MNNLTSASKKKGIRLGLALLGGLLALTGALLIVFSSTAIAQAGMVDLQPNLNPSDQAGIPILAATGDITAADVIDPPEGYPKLDQSIKTVTPPLASTGGETLYYTIYLTNTAAYTAENAILTDFIPRGRYRQHPLDG